MGKIIIINTGGTIAMAVDQNSDAVDLSSEQPLHQITPLLEQYGEIIMYDLFNLPSPHMTPEHMLQLANEISNHLAESDVIGVVVTHGTDTLEESAYFLDLVLDPIKPVVLTGAMRSSNELGADGPINVLHSVRVATSPASCRRGVLVVFNDEIHAARFVTKTHTSNVATFQSPQHGPIGSVAKKSIQYLEAPLPVRSHFPIDRISKNIPLVKTVTGMRAEWLSFLLADDIDGVVIEAFGAGNVPPAIVPVIESLCQKQKPVLLVSRCYNGYVQDLYGYMGGGKQLKQLGVLFSNGLNGQKARLKLLVSLQANYSLMELNNIFS
jgi:L-asparaginase